MELNDLVLHGSELLGAILRDRGEWSLSGRYEVACYGETVAIEATGSRKTGVDQEGIAAFLKDGLDGLPVPRSGAEALLQVITLLLSNDHFIVWYSRDARLSETLGRVIAGGLVRWKQCLCLYAGEEAIASAAVGGPLQVAGFGDIPALPDLPTLAVYHDLGFADLGTVMAQVRHHRRMVFLFGDAAVGASFVAALRVSKPDLSFHAAAADQPGGPPLYVGYAC